MSDEKRVAENNDLQSSSGALLDEAELMIWALLDEEIAEQDSQKLEKLLAENEQVRQRYVECTQLHVDLTQHFAPQKATAGEADGGGSGIISKLITEHLPAPGINPPVVD